ncbi:hypothetical protein [Escherichia coli]|uniref:hypothetical protein n=1 Tax=Escherichia coli TaxID=562 RepID=UPI001F0E0B82|nr:hypothetical protein [Escherichia coli]
MPGKNISHDTSRATIDATKREVFNISLMRQKETPDFAATQAGRAMGASVNLAARY